MKINKIKMLFKMDDNDEPLSYRFEEHSASHWMIEELMLLANKVVSVFLCTESAFDPELQNSIVLRKHPAPDEVAIAKVKVAVAKMTDVPFDATTSKTLYESLKAIRREKGNDLADLVEYMVMKCMRPAEYLFFGGAEDVSHYALSFQFYTHFTSPIRRYADIMVHRQLEWVLHKRSGMADSDLTSFQCDACNVKKRSSRLAQEAFDKAFFCIYLRNKKSITVSTAVVKAVMEKQIIVYSHNIAAEAPVFYQLNEKNSTFPADYLVEERKSLPMLAATSLLGEERARLTWSNGVSKDVAVFDTVNVVVLPLDTVPISFTVLIVP